ncbi:MAG TPA: hypothetical protein VFZ64_16300 [Nocardioidaceae bacterium]
MAERLTERAFWWVVIGAGAVGVLLFTALLAVGVWGIFAGPPAPVGR